MLSKTSAAGSSEQICWKKLGAAAAAGSLMGGNQTVTLQLKHQNNKLKEANRAERALGESYLFFPMSKTFHRPDLTLKMVVSA